MNLKTAISKLMRNDHNGTWDECKTIQEVRDGIEAALEGYEEGDSEYEFLRNILNELEGN